MSLRPGCILRITKEEWVHQVFDLRMYYTGVKRKWTPGMMIFFARNSGRGDSFIGSGVIQTIKTVDELTENEKRECQEYGWTRRLDFSKMSKFEPPVLLRNTPLANVPQKGSFLQGYYLNESEIDAILNNVQTMIES
jgi:hypothetical protein